MICVCVNESSFDYDIHSLVKAFYPTDEVKVTTDKENTEENTENTVFSVLFEKEKITMLDGAGKLLCSMEVPENAERVQKKNIVKRLVYISLKNVTGKELAWGDLTGIRPTKIARKLLDEGKGEDEIFKYMQDTYLVGDEKGRLAIDIAKREKAILSRLDPEKGYSLYIGIAFCPTTCLYCSFPSNSIGMWKNRVEDYIKALEKEIDCAATLEAENFTETIYIGGGTPTTLTADQLERLLTYVEEHIDLSHINEYTVEAGRADSITPEKLKVLKKHGVTRISVNPQTFNQRTLDIIGRRHTVEDVYRAYSDAREAGFDNINMDIILGLPEEGPDEVRHTIDEVVRLAPDSLTVHSLAIKRASRLHEQILAHGYSTMINTPETMRIAEEGAMALNLKPYYLYRQKNMAGNFENTGYAREGCYGIYNILIMEEVQSIIACGAGTVTKRRFKDGSLKRCDTVKDAGLYIENIDEMIRRKRELFSE